MDSLPQGCAWWAHFLWIPTISPSPKSPAWLFHQEEQYNPITVVGHILGFFCGEKQPGAKGNHSSSAEGCASPRKLIRGNKQTGENKTNK